VGPIWHDTKAGRVGWTQSVSADGEAMVALGVHILLLIEYYKYRFLEGV
jgi:hypothetical protein